MTLKWNGDQFEREVLAAGRKKLAKCATLVQNRIKENIKTSARSAGYSPAGHYPHRNMGNLSRAVFWDWESDTSAIVGVLPMGGIGKRLELGGTIRTTKKMMAVPVSPEAIRWSQMGKWPNTFKKKLELVPSTSRGGKHALLVEKLGKKRDKGAHWIIHYLLTNTVNIAAHPYIIPSFQQCQPEIQRILQS